MTNDPVEQTTAPSDEEIAEVARELWLARNGNNGSAEEDWFRAAEIVRNRRSRATGATTGNFTHEGKSHSAGTADGRIESDKKWKEQADMDNTTMTGSTEQTGTFSGSSGMSDRLNKGREQINQMMENDPRSMPRMEHREGRIARSLEQQTARIPSDAWLWAAVGSMGLSLALEMSGKEKTANFVGHWAPTLLIFGLYNKIVKLQGSDGI
jgi:hypothetical protein